MGYLTVGFWGRISGVRVGEGVLEAEGVVVIRTVDCFSVVGGVGGWLS